MEQVRGGGRESNFRGEWRSVRDGRGELSGQVFLCAERITKERDERRFLKRAAFAVYRDNYLKPVLFSRVNMLSRE